MCAACRLLLNVFQLFTGSGFSDLNRLDFFSSQYLFFINAFETSLQTFFIAGGVLVDILVLDFAGCQIRQKRFAGFKLSVKPF